MKPIKELEASTYDTESTIDRSYAKKTWKLQKITIKMQINTRLIPISDKRPSDKLAEDLHMAIRRVLIKHKDKKSPLNPRAGESYDT